jgi:hypothetical protein
MKRDLLSPLWTQSEPPSLSPIEWEALLSQARCTRLLGRLALHLADRGWLEQVPDAPRLHLDNARRRVRRQQDETRWETDCIRRAIGHLPTPIVLLKGAAYILGELAPSRGRLFTDVDILVARDQLRAVEMALLAAGWYAAKLDPYDERYYRDWMHELPPLQHIERGTALDVHHTITPPTSRFAVDAALLLASARPLAECPRLSLLAPADMVLHSLVHLMQDGDFSGGLRDLLDLSDLLQAYGRDPAFWPELARRARELGLGIPLHHVLQQLRRLTSTRPPPDFEREVQAIAPGRLRGRLMSELLTIALRPEHPDCRTAFTGPARWLLYVRSHWLRMPWYQIAPHLLRKAWVRTADRYRGKNSDISAPGI